MAKVIKTIGLPIKQTPQDSRLMKDLNAVMKRHGHTKLTDGIRYCVRFTAEREARNEV
jgi:hypothetical protein